MSVTVRDTGWGRIKRELKLAAHSGVKVGIQEGSKRREGGSQVALAVTHEYGDDDRGIPERSFMRSSFRENRTKLVAQTAAEYKAIVSGKKTTKQALGLLGQLHESQVKAKLMSNIPPPLKQATIDRKGSSRTLVDTKQLHDGIRPSLDMRGKK